MGACCAAPDHEFDMNDELNESFEGEMEPPYSPRTENDTCRMVARLIVTMHVYCCAFEPHDILGPPLQEYLRLKRIRAEHLSSIYDLKLHIGKPQFTCCDSEC